MFSLAVVLVLFYYIRSLLQYRNFFCATLTYKGEEGLGQCYIILGGRSEVLIYNVIWGRGLSKNQHFLCYIICGRPLKINVYNPI